MDGAAQPPLPWSDGAGWMEGAFRPLAEMRLPVTDWGFTRSDVTYDVVHVWDGAFFRLDDHLDRFERSVAALRMTLGVDRAAMTRILAGCVCRAGLESAYVAMVATRGTPLPGLPRHPASCRNRFFAYAVPFAWVIPPDVQERGAHVIVAKTPRIPAESVDPTIKNYHWADMTRALFEASDAGADNAVLLDAEGWVTEGPGFNVFAVRDGRVLTPDRGALEGITRRTVMELAAELGLPVEETRLTADDLREADELFFATTAGGVMPVSRIDGRILANDRPGPITLRLKELYWQRHNEGWKMTPVAALVAGDD